MLWAVLSAWVVVWVLIVVLVEVLLTVLATDTTSPSCWFVVSSVPVSDDFGEKLLKAPASYMSLFKQGTNKLIGGSVSEIVFISTIRKHEYTTNEDSQ